LASYKLSIDLSQLLGANSAIANAIFPMVGQAVRAVAEEGSTRWKDSVYKAHLWQVEKDAYVESISWTMVNALTAEISSSYDFANKIETGRPARDQKRSLQTSKKARVVKHGAHTGLRYLIIPFRHNVPTPSGEGALAHQMPAGVYAMAKKLSASHVLEPGSINPPTRLSATGSVVAQQSYSWGDRLPAGTAPKLQTHHKADPYAGMVRFDTGGGKSSSYMTFRIMGEWSTGWIIPAKPGLLLAKGVSDGLQNVLEDVVGKAVTMGALKG